MKIREDITDFIGVFENAVPLELCDNLMQAADGFIDQDGISRQDQSGGDHHMVQDTSHSIHSTMINWKEHAGWHGIREMHDIVQDCTVSYLKEFPVFVNELKSYHIKFQRTLPTEGYHIWHSENASPTYRGRDLVWTVFLNTIAEGGETEFLYQRRRVPAKQGSVLVFPASFTHTHRGNPPLSGTKYIATGWWTTCDV